MVIGELERQQSESPELVEQELLSSMPPAPRFIDPERSSDVSTSGSVPELSFRRLLPLIRYGRGRGNRFWLSSGVTRPLFD